MKANQTLIATVILLLLVLLFSYPVFQGKRLESPDIKGWMSQAYQMKKWEEKTGEPPGWAWHIFSGMPNIFVYAHTKSLVDRLLKYTSNIFPFPLFAFIIGIIFSVLLFKLLGRNDWRLVLLGSSVVLFSTFTIVSISAGHVTKIIAYMCIPGIIAGILMLMEGKFFSGLLCFMVSWTIMVNSKHIQVIYYAAIVIVTLSAIILYRMIKARKTGYLSWLIPGSILATAVPIALRVSGYWHTAEFTPYSIRGTASELTQHTEKQRKGLDPDYAFQWSYGIMETFTLYVPRIVGGSKSKKISRNSYLVQELKKAGVPNRTIELIRRNLPSYWGSMPFTDGPVYMGIITILGLWIAIAGYWKNTILIPWAFILLLLCIMLAWGKNFFLAPLAFEYLPGFNKFRTPMMIFLLVQILAAILAVLGFKHWFDEQDKLKQLKTLKLGLALTGGILLIILAGGILLNSGTFSGPGDIQLEKQWGQFMDLLREQRKRMLIGDAFRNLLFTCIAGILMWLTIKERVKKELAITLLSLLAVVDLIGVDMRYHRYEAFTKPLKWNRVHTPREVDIQIKRDTTYYRVIDFTVGNPFIDSRTPYFHLSAGGYLPARLRIYQDLIDSHLSRISMPVYNMLNVKYFILPGRDNKPQVHLNTDACGPAWFADSISVVPDARTVVRMLGQINTCKTALVTKEEALKHKLTEKLKTATHTSADHVTLVYASPDSMVYEYRAKAIRLLVLAEIYYPPGWKAHLEDGTELEIIRVNHALRAVVVPPGEHRVIFEYRPASLVYGLRIEFIASVIWFVLVIISGFAIWKGIDDKFSKYRLL